MVDGRVMVNGGAVRFLKEKGARRARYRNLGTPDLTPYKPRWLATAPALVDPC